MPIFILCSFEDLLGKSENNKEKIQKNMLAIKRVRLKNTKDNYNN